MSGDEGSGRTSFARRLLKSPDPRRDTALRVNGAAALKNIPFVALTTLAAQAAEGAALSASPAFLIGVLARGGTERPARILLDDAEHIDEHSAAALSQLALSGLVRLICVTGRSPKLPPSLASISAQAAHVSLADIDLEDTTVLLNSFVQGKVNVSTADRFLRLSAANVLHLRELAFDAQAHDAFVARQGFTTIDPGWVPQQRHTTELLTARLRAQPASTREAVELLALTGPIVYGRASALVGAQVVERAHDAGLIDIISADDDSSPRQSRVQLGSSLHPELVLAALDRPTLRSRIAKIRDLLAHDDVHPNARVWLALHSSREGIVPTASEMCDDVQAAVRARQFPAAVVLSAQASALPDAPPALWLARSEALHEVGAVEEAQRVLAPLIEAGDPDARMRAAWIVFSAVGDADAALALVDPRDGDPAAVAAFRRHLVHLGRGAMEAIQRAADVADQSIDSSLRFRMYAQSLVERAYAGEPRAVLTEIADVFDSALWKDARPTERGDITHALFLAGQYDGVHETDLTALSERVDWDELAFDHAPFISARVGAALETGDAQSALKFALQVFPLLEQADPYLLAAVPSAYAATAAAMLGKKGPAADLLARFATLPSTAGHSLRGDIERVSLHAHLEVHGTAASQGAWQKMCAAARERGRLALEMRLWHDGWRLRLHDDVAAVSLSAQHVDGTLAGILRDYHAAFTGDGALEEGIVESLVERHRETGRVLYAAEVAARASDIARARGEAGRASRLLGMSADLANTLPEVNTPSLDRVRIDAALLTPREYDVCRRAAEGSSNIDIAEGLFLSARTVEGHLQRAYMKLGASDRRRLIPLRMAGDESFMHSD